VGLRMKERTTKMRRLRSCLWIPCLSFLLANSGSSQIQLPNSVPTSVDSKLVMDAAGDKQRKALTNIWLILCPGVGAGTGFVTKEGFLVTNSHVVSSCNETNLRGIGTTNNPISFSKIIKDEELDLAILVPSKKLALGLAIYDGPDPLPGLTVSTWGFPLLYDGATPLLSVGYVSGFRMVEGKNGLYKHIVVNAAFNHGNSGGPLLGAQNNEVLGVVVLTYHFHPPIIRQIIDTMAKNDSGVIYAYKDSTGKTTNVAESQINAAVLDEFYQTTQVMIGEAISSSELKKNIHAHASEIDVPAK
jgi:Trypsin-like peptidase domain